MIPNPSADPNIEPIECGSELRINVLVVAKVAKTFSQSAPAPKLLASFATFGRALIAIDQPQESGQRQNHLGERATSRIGFKAQSTSQTRDHIPCQE